MKGVIILTIPTEVERCAITIHFQQIPEMSQLPDYTYSEIAGFYIFLFLGK
jgi:hypothetical protein